MPPRPTNNISLPICTTVSGSQCAFHPSLRPLITALQCAPVSLASQKYGSSLASGNMRGHAGNDIRRGLNQVKTDAVKGQNYRQNKADPLAPCPNDITLPNPHTSHNYVIAGYHCYDQICIMAIRMAKFNVEYGSLLDAVLLPFVTKPQ